VVGGVACRPGLAYSKTMSRIRRNQNGFGAVETAMVIVFVVLIGLLSWYVFHVKRTTDKNLSGSSQAAAKSGGKSSGGTDNQSLQSDLDSLEGTNNQSNKDLSSTNSGLNDSSTFTSLPQ
jgi:cytoskeletal protein RodZ